MKISYLFLSVLTLLCSCTSNNSEVDDKMEKEDIEELSAVSQETSGFKSRQYLFQDDNGVYHIDNSCRNLRKGNNERGRKIYAMRFVDMERFMVSREDRYCSECVGIEDYERLKLNLPDSVEI